MKTFVVFIFAITAIGYTANAQSVEGKAIFSGNCQACHSIGQGKIVGPDLEGVTERRDEDWIKSFITNSQKMVAEGDEQAVEVFNEFNKMPMPSHNFSTEELNQLVSYMDEASEEARAAQVKEKEKASSAPIDKVEKAEAAVGENGEVSWMVKGLLGLLAISAIILFIATGYLYKIVKS